MKKFPSDAYNNPWKGFQLGPSQTKEEIPPGRHCVILVPRLRHTRATSVYQVSSEQVDTALKLTFKIICGLNYDEAHVLNVKPNHA